MRLRPVLAVSLLSVSFAVVLAFPAHAQDLTVQLTKPAEGAKVKGSVAVEATAGSAATSVAFDWSGDGGGTWTAIATDSDGTDGWTTTWETGSFSGGATVRATASDGSATVSDSNAVTVDNAGPNVSVSATPNPFSPNDNGVKDRTTVTIDASEAATLSLKLFDNTGALRRSWPGEFSSSGEREIVYGGGDDRGGYVEGGIYTLEATAVDGAGNSSKDTSELRVDLGFPSASWRNIYPEPISSQTSMSFVYYGWDWDETLNVELHVYDALGEAASLTGLIRERGERTLTWVPRYSNGNLLYPGKWRARVRIEDDAGNVTWTGYRSWRVHRSMTATVFRRLSAGNRVALTFDDCYSSTGWDQVLDQLAARGVKASFFCSGPYVSQFSGLALRTRDNGHTIGSHGWDHASMPGRSLADQQQRLRNDQNTWWSVASETTAPYFRPPYGAYDSTTLSAAGTTSHPRVIMWDVDPQDYATSSSSLIASRVLSAVKPGSIVVMHALPQTAAALPSILNGLSDRGLTPVSLAQMFRAAGYK